MVGLALRFQVGAQFLVFGVHLGIFGFQFLVLLAELVDFHQVLFDFRI